MHLERSSFVRVVHDERKIGLVLDVFPLHINDL